MKSVCFISKLIQHAPSKMNCSCFQFDKYFIVRLYRCCTISYSKQIHLQQQLIFINKRNQFAYYTNKQERKSEMCKKKRNKTFIQLFLLRRRVLTIKVILYHSIMIFDNNATRVALQQAKNLTKYCSHSLINLKSNKVCVRVRF